jgi:hypothetical protein
MSSKTYHFLFDFNHCNCYIILIVFFFKTFSLSAGQTSDSLIATLVSQVNQDSIEKHIRRLQDFGTRYALSDSCRAAETYLSKYFSSLNLDNIKYDTVIENGIAMRNVIGEITGNVDPEAFLILCAHIDAMSESPEICAPGAEDNASGISVIMEASRILCKMKLPYTIMFIGFTGEDIGITGSQQMAISMSRSCAKISALLNLDMVGWPGGAFGIKILCDSTTLHLAKIQNNAIQTYTSMDPEIVVRPPLPSDNYYFQTSGFPCLANIERFVTSTSGYKWYHSCGDTAGNISFPLVREVAKASIATLIKIMEIPAPPSQVKAGIVTQRSDITFSWNRNSEGDLAGYRAFWGPSSRKYTDSIDILHSESVTISPDTGFSTLYFAVKSIDTNGNSSWYSCETLKEMGAETRNPEKVTSPVMFTIRQIATAVEIDYSLKEGQLVVIKIYDFHGRLIRKLFNEYQPAGMKQILWDRRNSSGDLCSSGLYAIVVSGTYCKTLFKNCLLLTD